MTHSNLQSEAKWVLSNSTIHDNFHIAYTLLLLFHTPSKPNVTQILKSRSRLKSGKKKRLESYYGSQSTSHVGAPNKFRIESRNGNCTRTPRPIKIAENQARLNDDERGTFFQTQTQKRLVHAKTAQGLKPKR
ncbi:hypothetical protein CC1G_04057 [Coprinopsis cinerea okayama7|uniref:Uncharacterized protein n=1 Tax=Coprinopsis cinerea (strain Okayama-7 / 130 / ATCC MYA-4618 / FGSC 9003) TaxID=240176 RepID=A8NVS4_COPC7|nr:hypothetical protein CC1G_04057 [Coprinopsis cinerea okayama7\|eukprot:XP_001836744.2 hypothetical protein CC1G_04057 [Coprinopsis cinerea okayama7\